MIEVLGEDGTSERKVADAIAGKLGAYWPGLMDSPAEAELLKITAGAKLSGYRVQDIDVVVCGAFRSGRRFLPKGSPRDSSTKERMRNVPVSVYNLVVAIEVKDHDPKRINFEGDTVNVDYIRAGKRRWHSATQQNIDQVHSLKNYFSDQRLDLFIHRLIVLRGLPEIVSGVNGVLPRDFSGAEFLDQVAMLSGVRSSKAGRYYISSGTDDAVRGATGSSIFRVVRPSVVDRRRMDRIASRKGLSNEWFDDLGKKLIVFRGRGGAGKTVLLLQLAWRAFQERGARTLLLTYNLTLVADIRRTMALLGVPSSPDQGGIQVDTVMSVQMTWMRMLGVIDKNTEDTFDRYGEYCAAALEMIEQGAVTPDDIEDVKQGRANKLSFDYIVADEGQDWPQQEADLLKAIYGSKSLAVADGVDQRTRGSATNWTSNVPEDERRLVVLRRCLRLKENLAVFANAVAAEADLNWRVEPNDEAGGGRIIVLWGSYSEHDHEHRDLVASAAQTGNEPIDFLMCVPAADVSKQEGSLLGKRLTDRGLEVWDGTSETAKRDFPRSTNQFRIVQYPSCRGLEGWVVVADRFDEYWKWQYQRELVADRANSTDDLFISNEQRADRAAWLSCLIPLTRPIDTLVISVGDEASPMGKMMKKIGSKHPDFVELTERH